MIARRRAESDADLDSWIRLELASDARSGYSTVVTWTQRGNQAMRRVNERLGYEHRASAVTMCAPLPVALDSARS
jgi:mycothiol synthase